MMHDFELQEFFHSPKNVLLKALLYTQYKSKLVPPEGIRFPANLGLVLTQLTTWDEWQAV